MSEAPWQKFKVDDGASRWSCQPLTSVSHVSHVPTALRIVEDSTLRADLVFDESKLNTHRIRVVWLSPNEWARGYRYGNVRFTYDWARLVAGKRYYWVESIAYGIEACRILVTETDWSGLLDEYDPERGDGPWWQKDDAHFWNGDYTLEVMIEGDLRLADATNIDFVTHNDMQCCNDYRTCPYLGVSARDGGAELVATLAARREKFELPGFVVEGPSGQILPGPALELALDRLVRHCGVMKIGNWGTVRRADPAAQPLARAVLGILGKRTDTSGVESLAVLFADLGELLFSIADVIAKAVCLSDADALVRDYLPLLDVAATQ